VARGWRAGCILRSPLIETIAGWLRANPASSNLLAMPADEAADASWRRLVAEAAGRRVAAPALASALAYADGWRTARSGANLIEAMRDVFGRHGFARLDRPGRHHADWPEA
jgi:6-phosphogluconate dehydrogenase